MESISSQNTPLSQSTAATTPTSAMASTPAETAEIILVKSKQLQPDKVEISTEAKNISAEERDTEDKKSIDASSLSGIMSLEEAAAAEKANESDLDKRIRELSMEILEISVKIQLLQDKEDKESVKERQKLEVDLAMKKGELEATMDRKLQEAAL
ncbi:hypothetical protein [Colwellia psychrerythraea]|uniref:Uncharacterized protein n=1 Tax=Colwellia psychrerythraea TaxID=28229 RepID=A0A099KND0_COLPS|nr:hypothetical protein [Colwellia psychrerythraea]KGJ91735.1 hypothetical protein GAB14E_3217 [Colwellia psychrerythraea]